MEESFEVRGLLAKRRILMNAPMKYITDAVKDMVKIASPAHSVPREGEKTSADRRFIQSCGFAITSFRPASVASRGLFVLAVSQFSPRLDGTTKYVAGGSE